MSTARVDMKTLCRLCAKMNKHCVNVFSNDGNKHFIEKKIRLCLPITIKENDVLPQTICLSCLNKLDTCYELYSGCISAQSTIMKLIESLDVSMIVSAFPNTLIKVRSAVRSYSSPNTSARSLISLQDFLKQEPADICPVTKGMEVASDITPHKSANEVNNETNKTFQRNSDSGCPRIKMRKLDTAITKDNEMISVDRGRKQRMFIGTELQNNNLSSASILQPVEDNEVSACNPAAAMNISLVANSVQTDSSSSKHNLLPKITNLHSLAKPSVSCIVATNPTAIMTSDSGGYQMTTPSMNDMQAPQNVYLTSISDSTANPCSQMIASPISSTYVASQTLVPSPLITSTYITSPHDNTNQITQTITPNYLIQQPINSGTTTSNALVYMNTLNPGTNLLAPNTSQHINFSVSPAVSINNNLLLTQDLPNQPSSTQNSDVTAYFNKFASNTTADKTSTTATPSIFASQSPVINNVQSLSPQTYERVNQVTNIPSPQTDAVSQIAATNSSALTRNSGNLPQEKALNAETKCMSNGILQNLLLLSAISETCNQNIKNGNVGNKITSVSNSKLNSQVSIHVSNKSSLTKGYSANKNSSNKLRNGMATKRQPVWVPHSSSNNVGPPPPVFFEQRTTVAATLSADHLQPHTISSSRSSVDDNSLSTATNSLAINNPSVEQQAAVVNRVYTHNLRPTPHSAASSTFQKSLTASPANVHKTTLCPASASISQVNTASLQPASAVAINGAGSASHLNSVSAERNDSVGEVKEDNKLCSVRTLEQEVCSNAVVGSSTDSRGSRSENTQKEEPPLNSENKCPYCNKYFDSNILIHHKVLHFRKKFFSCIDCGKNFKTEIGLQKHRCQVE